MSVEGIALDKFSALKHLSILLTSCNLSRHAVYNNFLITANNMLPLNQHTVNKLMRCFKTDVFADLSNINS